MALKTLYATFEAERAEQQYHDLMLEQILGSDVRDAIMEAAEEEDTKETKRDKTGHPEEDGESKDSDKKSKDSDEETDDSKDSKKSDKEDEEATEESFFMDEDAILNYVGEADAEDAEAEDTVTEAETEETEDEEQSEEDEALEALIDSIPETDPSECGDCAPVGSVEEALIFDEIDRLVPDTVLY